MHITTAEKDASEAYEKGWWLMFWVRLRSSVILLIITIAAILLGGNVMFGVVLAVSLIGTMELFRVMKINRSVLGLIGYAAVIAYDLLLLFGKEEYRFELIIIYLLLLLFAYVLHFPKFTSEQMTMAFFGLFYVGIMLSYLYRIRMLQDGLLLIWLAFIGSWGSDSCAYCVGILIGRHKAFPKLSPKKTVEGCIGGIAGAALLGLIYGTIFKNSMVELKNPQIACLIICGAAAVISQLGDLAASAIKRNHDIKDYGKLIPGHGGILDRFDSVIVTAPIVYLLAVLLKI